MMQHTNSVLYNGIPQDDEEEPLHRTSTSDRVYKPYSRKKSSRKDVKLALLVFMFALLIVVGLSVAFPIVYTHKTAASALQNQITQSDTFDSRQNAPFGHVSNNNTLNGNPVNSTLKEDLLSTEYRPSINTNKDNEKLHDNGTDKNIVTTENTNAVTSTPSPIYNSKDNASFPENNNSSATGILGAISRITSLFQSANNTSTTPIPMKNESLYLASNNNSFQTIKHDNTNSTSLKYGTENLNNSTNDIPATSHTTESPQTTKNPIDTKTNETDAINDKTKNIPKIEVLQQSHSFHTWLRKIGINTPAAVIAVAAASIFVGFSFLLFAFICIGKRRRKNRRVKIQNMVTDLQSPDKVVLLNDETSEEE